VILGVPVAIDVGMTTDAHAAARRQLARDRQVSRITIG
jgi:hypothetical protein